MGSNRNNEYNPRLHVAIEPNIGLDRDTRQSVVEMLNQILADEAVLMTKTRSAHWNVSGQDFYGLRTFFNDQLKQLYHLSDDIAERVRVLGGMTISSLTEVLAHAQLVERPGEVPNILHLLADHETVIRFLRKEIQKCAEEYEDEGTAVVLVCAMSIHEKMAWMLRSYTETEAINSRNKEII